MTLLLALAALASAASGAQRPYRVEELAAVREFSSVAISPDGCRVAFAADISGAVELWLSPACERGAAGSTGPRRDAAPLVAEPKWPEQLSSLGEQVTEVLFAPDGRSLVFASDYGGDEKRDLFLARLDGGGVEALARTPAAETDPDADRGLAFSKDGRFLAYVADAERPFLFQLFVPELAPGTTRRLTNEPASVRQPAWSPDGRTLAVTRTPDGQRGDLLFVDLASGATRAVEPPEPGGMLLAEEYLPDGSAVLALTRNARGFFQMALVDARGAGPTRFIGPGDWDVEQAAYRPGVGYVFSRNENAQSALYRMSSETAAPVRLLGPAGRLGGFDLDASGRRMAFAWGDSSRPADVWVLDLPTGKRVRAARAAAAGVDPERLARGRMLSYPSVDKTTIHALFVPAASAALGAPPPVVVVAHGGPDWQVFDEFDAKIQALSQAGIAVLAPNYRGSTGYGKEFLDLNNKDWGGRDLEDLAAGVRHLAGLGLADEARAGITGGSYGGYLTLMALATASSTWKAGVEAYGMPDLTLDFKLSGDRFIEWYKTEMGTPETEPRLFRERSALTHVANISAPLLVFQGANDTNVPAAESELIYRKLLERRVPVGLVVYPDEGHGFTRRANRIDYYRRTVEFFVKELGRPRSAAAGPASAAGEKP